MIEYARDVLKTQVEPGTRLFGVADAYATPSIVQTIEFGLQITA
jgi:hypothetical protein